MKKQNVKVCHLTTVHKPNDVRIYQKECLSLAACGYEVSLIAPYEKNFSSGEITYIPIRKRVKRIPRMLAGPMELLGKARKIKADIYHFHDPELISIGIFLRLLGKKVIYDVHEDYPGQIRTKRWLGPLIIRRCMAAIMTFAEWLGASLFTGMIAVTAEIAARFPADKTVVVSNYPVLGLIDRFPEEKVTKEHPVVLFAGGLDRIRGIREIIMAIGSVRNNAELWLLGPWEDERFRKECMELDGWEKTRYLGNVPFGKHYSWMKAADIGVINFYAVDNHIFAMPNKPFEYMACGLPMVMSNFEKWKAYFSPVALFADPERPEEIAAALDELLEHEGNRQRMSLKAREMVQSEFSWEKEKEVLSSFYEKLV